MMDFGTVGVRPDALLTPAAGVCLEKWACVACDQYTSEPEYWEETDRIVGDAPSCLRLILPECYLSGAAQRIPQIHRTMQDYCARGVLQGGEPVMMLIGRTTPSGTRRGLVCTVDLDAYDFTGRKSLVRPTEETIIARLPPRIAVRREAPVETSHVMLLIDDPADTVIGSLQQRLQGTEPTYDFKLMQGCGHLTGWRVQRQEDLQAVHDALCALRDALGTEPLLFAVGDGNHSLATAKAHWLELSRTLPEEQRANHPARFAMVEIVNIHDPALTFEPIHRLLTGVDAQALLADWAHYAAERGMRLSDTPVAGAQQVDFICAGETKTIHICSPDGPIPVATLQRYLDDYLARCPGAQIDYIHGDDVLRRLACEPGCAGFLLPALDKSAFFPAIETLGTLPRKTFSMGHAYEKRCYFECRMIR
ncbi:MAG: DUF1015 domain-containing protein [Clostridia bacterium]|nr:DUF1015 domain-containing protein [Clostridia bacterium]